MNALRRTARPDGSAHVIDLAEYIQKLHRGNSKSEGEFWSRYSAQAAILRVLNELRRERRALQNATRTLEHLATMRGEQSGPAYSLGARKQRSSRRLRVRPAALSHG